MKVTVDGEEIFLDDFGHMLDGLVKKTEDEEKKDEEKDH